MKVGDLIREKQYPTAQSTTARASHARRAQYGIIVEIGDLRTKEPYKVYCPGHGKVVAFKKKYIQEDCEVINESR